MFEDASRTGNHLPIKPRQSTRHKSSGSNNNQPQFSPQKTSINNHQAERTPATSKESGQRWRGINHAKNTTTRHPPPSILYSSLSSHERAGGGGKAEVTSNTVEVDYPLHQPDTSTVAYHHPVEFDAETRPERRRRRRDDRRLPRLAGCNGRRGGKTATPQSQRRSGHQVRRPEADGSTAAGPLSLASNQHGPSLVKNCRNPIVPDRFKLAAAWM